MAERVYITEDDDSIRELVTVALSAYSYEVESFVSAEDCLAATEKQVPDIFLFDIMLPGMDGVQAVKILREREETKNTPILMLTAKSAEIDKVFGLENGADDYLTKPFGIMELAARIKALLRRAGRGSSDSSSEKITAGGITINTALREVSRDGKPVELTLKEYELLLYLLKNRSRVVSREELLTKVWGIDFVGETRTLDMHIGTLRKKLSDDAENAHLIKTVRGIGYRFIGE
ncbi:MAG: response regulator transcription factor [Ruminiclostridium sp.]|nr:response regulator transcription factor [Ruminiclostridium sp.]